MSLNTVTTGNTILAADINQLVYVLQRQSGQSETGKYYTSQSVYVNGGTLGTYYSSLNRVSVPISATIDATDAQTNCNAPSNDHLTANGLHIFSSSTGISNSVNLGGNVTLNF